MPPTPTPTRTETGRAARRESVREVMDAAWAPAQANRPVLRPAVALTIVVFSAFAALATGVVMQLVHPTHDARPTVVTAPPPASTATFTAVSGWDCEPTAEHGFDIQGRTAAWITVATGGWASDGCHGTFETIPMSGKKTTDDTGQSVLWWFTPGSAVQQCQVSVYRPAAPQPTEAGRAAQYFVLSGRTGSRLGEFILNQTTQPGSWTPVGTYPVGTDGIAVQMVDRGVPPTKASRLAVTQVKVVCSA